MKTKPTIYRVNYINQNQVYELYAEAVSTDQLFGFISISNILFDIKAGVVIDPTEEQMKTEFKDVETLHIPMNHVLKIEEVKQKKPCKIKPLHNETKVEPIRHHPGSKK